MDENSKNISFRLNVRNIINELITPNFNTLMNRNSMFNNLFLEVVQYTYTVMQHITHKIGYVWENVAQLFGFQKLDKGLDLIHLQRKIILEMKNNINTCNYDSKLNIMRKLKKWKNLYPDFMIVFGCLNDPKPKYYQDENGIFIITGIYFQEFLFEKEYQNIINIVYEEMKLKIDEINNIIYQLWFNIIFRNHFSATHLNKTIQ